MSCTLGLLRCAPPSPSSQVLFEKPFLCPPFLWRSRIARHLFDGSPKRVRRIHFFFRSLYYVGLHLMETRTSLTSQRELSEARAWRVAAAGGDSEVQGEESAEGLAARGSPAGSRHESVQETGVPSRQLDPRLLLFGSGCLSNVLGFRCGLIRCPKNERCPSSQTLKVTNALRKTATTMLNAHALLLIGTKTTIFGKMFNVYSNL